VPDVRKDRNVHRRLDNALSLRAIHVSRVQGRVCGSRPHEEGT
jgi:hypothetical protein